MSDKPLTPTRIIPAGQTAELPARGPQPGERPPWWEQPTPPASAPVASPPPPLDAPPRHEAPHKDAPRPVEAPPAAPAAAPPTVVEVHVTHDQDDDSGQEPPPRWSLAWTRTWLHPWWTLLAAILALIPTWTGYSAATTWAYTVSQARADFGPGWGYALAAGAFTLAVLADTRSRSWRIITRFWLVTSAAGWFGAIHWYDLITLITGVQP